MKAQAKRTLTLVALAVPAVAVLTALGILTWALTPAGPGTVARAALGSDSEVTVTRAPEGWVFAPAETTPVVGLVLYPGGRVDPRSYAPLAHEVARHGHLVVIVPMTLNMAVFSPDKAAEAIAAHPEVAEWAVGGHSLGGAMAAQYAAGDPRIRALVLLAAYPPASTDLSRRDVEVVSVWGTLDGVLEPGAIGESRSRLPTGTAFTPLQGGNHAQFGDYGTQAGDPPATIDAQAQTEAASRAVLAVLREVRFRAEF